MGWYFDPNWETRKELVKDLTKTEANDNRTRTCLAHCLRGNVLWSVVEYTFTDGTPPRRYLGCDLLQNGGGSGWGYKPMDEADGPCYYSCPLKYLNWVPDIANQAWRDAVIRQARLQRLQVEVGDLVGLDDRFVIKVVQITRKLSKSTLAAKDRDGKEFSIKRHYLSGETFTTLPTTT